MFPCPKTVCATLALALFSVGCAHPPDPMDLPAGDATALVNDTEWSTSGAEWLWSGTTLQITFPRADGWSFTVVAKRDADGESVWDSVEAEAFPVEVPLGQEGTGFAIVYPQEGGSLTTSGTPGSVTVMGVEGSSLYATFDFSASSEDQGIEVLEGQVHGEQFEM